MLDLAVKAQRLAADLGWLVDHLSENLEDASAVPQPVMTSLVLALDRSRSLLLPLSEQVEKAVGSKRNWKDFKPAKDVEEAESAT
jgi:hypothetical protein